MKIIGRMSPYSYPFMGLIMLERWSKEISDDRG